MARRNALRALGKSGDSEGIDPIRDLLISEDRWLRLSAMQACKALMVQLDEVGRAELAVGLDAAEIMEEGPLLMRLR